MTDQKQAAGIDYFRLAAACMVIAIHTSPFSVWSGDFDFLFTYCLCRTAVPFFFMTTGYFVLAPYLTASGVLKEKKKAAVRRYLIKNTALYFAVSLLYLPVMLYSKSLPKHAGEALKDIFFDGTFYHLWYFPAAITGCLLLLVLIRSSFLPAVIFSGAAYIFGLFGDSYYGIIQDIPALHSLYDGIFCISSYTRNGVFFAPAYLLLGVLLTRPQFRCSVKICLFGLLASIPAMLAEGYVLYSMDLQRHNSMYLFLLPVMYFMFQLLLSGFNRAPAWLRKSSMLIYVIHPAVIIAVRGFAKAIGQTDLFVTNTFIHYLTVCLISFSAAVLLPLLYQCFTSLFLLKEEE